MRLKFCLRIRAAWTREYIFASAISEGASGLSAKVAKPQSGLRRILRGPKRLAALVAFFTISSTLSIKLDLGLTIPNPRR